MIARAALATLALAACGTTPDPCEGIAGTCLAVHVESATVERLDALELDVLHGDLHATATTRPAGGGAVGLPLTTAIALSPIGDGPLRVGVVAAGKLGAAVAGTGAASATLAPGARASITIELSPIGDCVDGGLYCGGDKLAGDPDTLYQCDRDAVPKARGRCLAGCTVHPTADDRCAAYDADGNGRGCQSGGFYCGGDELDGDPRTLYECPPGTGVAPRVCPDGCVVAPVGTDDHCR